MTITDDFLTNMAKALNNETFSLPETNKVGETEVTNIPTNATNLSGVISGSNTLSSSRITTKVNFNTIRSSVDVVDTVNGDSIKSAGIFSSEDILQAGVVLDELHTVNFDLEFDWDITVSR